MPPRAVAPPVVIHPSVIRELREAAGIPLDRAAKRAKISEDTLRELEENGGTLDVKRVKELAKLYDQNFWSFTMQDAPVGPRLPDFRLIVDHQGQPWSPNLRREFRRVASQREIAVELDALSDRPTPEIDIEFNLNQDVERCATRLRGWIQIPARWPAGRNDAKILRWLIDLVEERGILVTQVSGVDVEEMRGCSISERPFPTIALNGRDEERGRIFSLMHEVVHILLRQSSLCDLEEPENKPNSNAKRIEIFCNAVAAATLIPREQLLAQGKLATTQGTREWTEAELARFARQYGVSNEALLRRLVTLERATMDYYLERRQEYIRPRPTRRGGRLFPPNKEIRNFGRRYVRMVLQAYERADINGADLSRFIGDINLSHVPDMRRRLGAAE